MPPSFAGAIFDDATTLFSLRAEPYAFSIAAMMLRCRLLFFVDAAYSADTPMPLTLSLPFAYAFATRRFLHYLIFHLLMPLLMFI